MNSRSQKISVLVVDDDPLLCKILSHRLKEGGFEVTLASDGAAALKLIQKHAFHAVLLDLIMPVMNGFEVLQQMRARRIETPVVVFSNLGSSADRKEALRAGASHYLVKAENNAADVIAILNQYSNAKIYA